MKDKKNFWKNAVNISPTCHYLFVIVGGDYSHSSHGNQAVIELVQCFVFL